MEDRTMRKIALLFAFATVLLSCTKEKEARPSGGMGTYSFSINAVKEEDKTK